MIFNKTLQKQIIEELEEDKLTIRNIQSVLPMIMEMPIVALFIGLFTLLPAFYFGMLEIIIEAFRQSNWWKLLIIPIDIFIYFKIEFSRKNTNFFLMLIGIIASFLIVEWWIYAPVRWYCGIVVFKQACALLLNVDSNPLMSRHKTFTKAEAFDNMSYRLIYKHIELKPTARADVKTYEVLMKVWRAVHLTRQKQNMMNIFLDDENGLLKQIADLDENED
ncbi:MAG: hypothetical protein MUE85_03465 [Microscillaceae bacterium]|jgi:hypothetical protein|nr:hypothetical protein [Microscillaceae bacterium]